jgi:hypothetical protein
MATESSIREAVKAWYFFFFFFSSVCLFLPSFIFVSVFMLAVVLLSPHPLFLRNKSALDKDRDAEKIDVKRIDATKGIVKLEYIDEGTFRGVLIWCNCFFLFGFFFEFAF